MKAGRELDALVAEHVMGFCLHDLGMVRDIVHSESECRKCDNMMPDEVWAEQSGWSPSNTLADAWQVVEKVARDHRQQFELRTYFPIGNTGCRFVDNPPLAEWALGKPWHPADDPSAGRADTVPLAICLAALKAVGYEEET